MKDAYGRRTLLRKSVAKEVIKGVIIFLVFFVAAPVAGVALKDKIKAQRMLWGIALFLSIGGLLGPVEFGLTLNSVEWYRGHAKGFYFYLICAISIAIVVANTLEKPVGLKFLSFPLLLYVFHLFMCLVSIVNAPEKVYTLMAFHKCMMFVWVFAASHCFLKTEEDLMFFLRTMAVVMLWEAFVMLKLRYIDGSYQVRGTFEHQNPLAMFSIMIACPLLAAGLGPKFKGQNLTLIGFAACGVTVLFTLSRAALAVFAASTVGILGFSTLWRPTGRKIAIALTLCMGGSIVLLAAADTIIARFNQKGNKESGETREIMNDMCRAMYADYKLGIGWNNYVHVANPPFPYSEIWWEYERSKGMRVDEERQIGAVESHYYLLLAENGWPGLYSYFLFIFIVFLTQVRCFFSYRESLAKWVIFGIAVGFVMNYAQSTLERVLTQPRNLTLWMILLGMTTKLNYLRRKKLFL